VNEQRLFAIALIVSLALNLFMFGILVGGFAHGMRPPPPPPHGGPEMRLMQLLEILPESSRERISPLLDKHVLEIRDKMDALRQAKRAVHTCLTKENFDAAALADSLARVQQTMFAVQTVTHNSFVEVVSQLNREERQKLSESMSRRPPD
jgi:uncharacterized membrane protein